MDAKKEEKSKPVKSAEDLVPNSGDADTGDGTVVAASPNGTTDSKEPTSKVVKGLGPKVKEDCGNTTNNKELDDDSVVELNPQIEDYIDEKNEKPDGATTACTCKKVASEDKKDDDPKPTQEDDKKDLFELDSCVLQEFEECEKRDIPSPTDKSSDKPNDKSKKTKEDRHVWIYNINPNTTAGQLKLDLTKYGKVLVAKIVTNGEKYFGYALMEKPECVKICIDKLNGKVVDGNELEITSDPPHKKRASSKPSKSKPERHSRKRDRTPDPLTLKVDAKKKQRSRSTSRKRTDYRRREEEARLKKRQRELEIEIENQKRKLEHDKREFERQKAEFIRWQKRTAEREKERKEREFQRKSYSPLKRLTTWRRSKSPRPIKTIVASRVDVRKRRSISVETIRNLSCNARRHREYKRSASPKKRERDVSSRLVPPPPPRLTNTEKLPPWKSMDAKKTDDYYKGKENYAYDSYDKGKDDKKRMYDGKASNGRSEVYVLPPRSAAPYSSGPDNTRRFDNVAYPDQYRNYPQNNLSYHAQPVPHFNAPPIHTWNTPVYNPRVPVKPPFHQDHSRFDDYDKRHQMFPQRRY